MNVSKNSDPDVGHRKLQYATRFPSSGEFFHTDRRTGGQRDVAKLIVAFGYFASTPKSVFFVQRHKPFGYPDKICFRGEGKEYMIVCLVLYLSACSPVFYSLSPNTGLMK